MARTQQQKDIAQLAAKILIEIQAVHFRSKDPFTLTSGWKSPVYIDCRKIISFPRARRTLMRMTTDLIYEKIGFESLDVIAGGETAGIPFAAWISENMDLPMVYIRKKPKGFGRNAQIEGIEIAQKRTLLVEDLTTDGASKRVFIKGLRNAHAHANYAFSIFFYDIFANALSTLKAEGIELLYLCSWWNILSVSKTFPHLQEEISEVEAFLKDPYQWSKAHGGVSTLEEARSYKTKNA